MEVLGLLDTLEAIILDGLKVPFSKKILVDEDKVLSIIDKMRLVIQGGEGLAKEAIAAKLGAAGLARGATAESGNLPEGENREDSKAVDILQQAYHMAKEIREGADKYADEVLANLEATSTRILRTIRAGRERLAKSAPVEAGK